MKRNYLYYLLVVILLLASCEKDPLAATTSIETQEVTSIVATAAIGGGRISSDGKPTIKECGLEWCTASDFKSNIFNCSAEKATLGAFSCEMTELTDATTYYVRSYAKNNYGTIYGPTVSFTTQEMVLPTVTTSEVTDITRTSASVSGEVTNDGNADVTERGIVYGTNQNPTIDDNKVSSGNGLGTFTCQLTKLQDGVTYYVRAYAVNSKGVAYGEEKSFTTKDIGVPTVTTSSATNISYTSATVGGNVTDDGGANVTERGVVYSTTSNPTISNSKVSSGIGKDAFTCNLNDLQDGTTYYVRAYAVNSKGLAYGEEKSFTTKDIGVPTVTTSSATNISYTSATVGGNVTDDGGANVTERGVVYSTTSNPTISNSKVSSGIGKDAFTCNLNDLQDGTTYYVRAYAVNEKGTAYGEEKSFVTVQIVMPTVTTSSIMNISFTSATVGGTVKEDGGAIVTERGVVYSTTPNPTTSHGKVSSGSGNGSFSCNLNDLQEGTTYYVCAYAVNQKGIAYGEEKSFTTNSNAFSVSSSKKVTFSSGNLQYNPRNNKWRFAESQLDYIGNANSNISSTYNGWIDLFGWSTSTTNFGVSTSIDYNDYLGSFVDWGTNKIGNDAPNTWRTLTYDEWDYVVFNRPNASFLRGVAQVNGVNGLILLPDNWSCPSDVIFKSGFHSGNNSVEAYGKYQTFTVDQWSKLESAGAVFLPAAGFREGSYVSSVQYSCLYWSATEDYSYNAYCIHIYPGGARMEHLDRFISISVRLVKDL